MKKFLIFIIVILSFFTLQKKEVKAFELYTANDIFAEVVPEIPGPNEYVEMKLKSYSFNLNNYYITWFLNGEKKLAGYGKKEFNFTTGPMGSVSKVIANIEVGDKNFKKEFYFAPAVVDFLWEVVDAYTPPFYRGKTIPLKQSKIKVTAIPETYEIAPTEANKLVYYWDRNYKKQVKDSGFGKNSITFDADPLLREERIKVVANDRKERSFAENILHIPTEKSEPDILFYRINKKGRVMTNKALNNFPNINGDTVKLSFHPLNMSTTAANFVDIFLKWNINGETKPPQDFGKQDELYITTNGKSGEIETGITIEGIKKLLQKGTKTITLYFTGEKKKEE